LAHDKPEKNHALEHDLAHDKPRKKTGIWNTIWCSTNRKKTRIGARCEFGARQTVKRNTHSFGARFGARETAQKKTRFGAGQRKQFTGHPVRFRLISQLFEAVYF